MFLMQRCPGRRTKLDYDYIGATKATLKALLPKLAQRKDDRHLEASFETIGQREKVSIVAGFDW
jgi:hypothetical protein